MVLSTIAALVFQHGPSGRRAPSRPPGCSRRGLGRVRDRVPHDRVDDLQPLPGHGLQRLVVPHPPRPAPVVVPSEPVVRADEGVAAEYQQVLELLVPAALRGGRPDAGPGPAVRGRQPAVARELVVAPEHRDFDRRDERGRGLRADPGDREQALVDLVAGERVGDERLELGDVGVEGGDLAREHAHRDVLSGGEGPAGPRGGEQRLPERPGAGRRGARAPGRRGEPAPARGGAPRRRAEPGEQRHLPAARGVDRPLERGVGLQQRRAQAVLRPGAR